MIFYTSFITIFIICILFINESSQLQYSNQKFPLKSYEKLDYNDFKFEEFQNKQKQKRQIKNSIDSPILETNRLKFNAFNRHFDIYLRRDINLVADHVDIEVRYSTSNKPSDHVNDFFTSNYYIGFVEDEPRSHVICYFEKNDTLNNELMPLIYAQIQIQNDNENIIYYIEPLLDTNNQNKNKYLVYRIDDIQSDIISNNIFNQTVCKPKYANDLVNQNDMLSANNSFLNEINREKRQANKKTNSKNQGPRQRKNRCYLALVADHRFFKEIGNSNVKLTTAYLINIIGAVNAIFTRTTWNMNTNYDNENQNQDPTLLEESTNWGFTVEKIIVHSEPTNSPHHYNSMNSSTDADVILQKFGEEDWSSYCLAHLFTFQGFENSVLGLAYVSSPLLYTLGGICSPTTRSRQMSVNTGLSSYKSMSQQQVRLLQREAELVTAHEFGHNWGSEHDPLKPECTPSSSNGGNFIMYAYSNQGHERNNFYFSPCSINSMSEVLKSKANCFKGESLSYCGNDRIEGYEQCDAGLNGRQGLDKCCDYDCKLKPGAECSDSNHYCCNQCKIATKGRKCFSSYNYIECFEDHSYCDGESKDCPTQKPKPANTPCNSHDSGKCNDNGQCMSLCQQMDRSYFACKCIDEDKRCMQCCRQVFNNGTSTCRPIQETFPNIYKSPVFMSNGRACHEGLCENRVCKQKVKDYVGRLWKVIQKVTVSGFLEFMKRNIVGSIIIISLLFWVPMSCCIHFCFDKRNRQMQKQKINQIMIERQNTIQSGGSSKHNYSRLATDEEPPRIVSLKIHRNDLQENSS